MMLFPLWFVQWMFIIAIAASAIGATLLLVLVIIDIKKRQMW